MSAPAAATARRAWSGLKLASIALAWLAGVRLSLEQPSLWPVQSYVAVTLAGLALALATRSARIAMPFRTLALVASAALIGGGCSGWQAAVRWADALPAELEGVDLIVTGTIASLPQRSASGTRFRFDVDEAYRAEERVSIPKQLWLGWYHDRAIDGNASETQSAANGLQAGQRWRLPVRLRQPHGSVNPQGFDYELWLFEQGLRATGSVRSNASAGAAEAPRLIDSTWAHPVERWRQAVRDAIDRQVPDAQAAGVLAALAVGDQAAIDRDDWDLFRNTGIAHLMSVSGLHITMFAWLAGAVIGGLWRRSARLALLLPAPSAARLSGVVAALAYSLFSGWGVPAQRTVWMLATTALLAASGRRWPWPLTLLAAAVVVSAFDPWALLQPGFWLSFVAVGLLMASSPGQRSSASASAGGASAWQRLWRVVATHARGGVQTQAIATIGLAPLTLVFFQQLSIVSFAANLVAIPLVSFVITPLALLGAIVPPLWTIGAALVHALDALLQLLLMLPGAVWSVGAAPAWAQAAGLAAGLIAVMPLPLRLKLLAVPLMLPLLSPVMPAPEAGQFELIAADIGQGTAVLIRTREHVLVYDTGPQYSPDSDAGSRVLLPLLRSRGEARVDRLVLSHRDTDHVGGAASLLNALPVESLASSLEDDHPLLALATQRGSEVSRCRAGQSWIWDGVRFDVLHPQRADYDHVTKSNALSCVVRVSGEHQRALLTGDIERNEERALVAAYGAALKSDLLVAPHHGSRTSSSAPLLDAVKPSAVVVQAGYRNRFGHPAAEVLERYRERAIMVFASPSCGAYVWTPATASCERVKAHRYWWQTPAL